MTDGEREQDEQATSGQASDAPQSASAPASPPRPPRPFDAEPEPEATEEPVAETPAEDVLPDPVVIDEHAEPEQAELFESFEGLPLVLESLLFVVDHAVEESYLARALDVTSTRIEKALDDLETTLREGQRGIRLQRGPEGVALVTAPEAAGRIEHFLGLEASRKLSTAALETLAIIAYRQPITRGQIDSIRGVSSDGAVATLRARALIAPAGYATGPGRPMLFQTTQRFLEHFGLERAGQLPPLPEEIDLPPSEIGEQLGLAEQDVVDALAAVEQQAAAAIEAGEIVVDADTPAAEDADADALIEDDERIEIPGDVQALTHAAEAALTHAAELAEAAAAESESDDAVDEADETDEPGADLADDDVEDGRRADG
jgi:segregation and condensation protein B